MTDRFRAALARGHLLLDAAMGTRLIDRGLRLDEDDPSLWNLDRPEDVAEIHRRDVAAGAHAILTNTFGASRAWLNRFGRTHAFEPINRRAVALARREAGPDRFVIGSIGPTAGDGPECYRDQAAILVEAGVDALIFETHRLDQAELALAQVAPQVPVPLLVSLFAWPSPAGEAVGRLTDLGASAIGLNCVAGMGAALQVAGSLRRFTSMPLIVKPSAGLPGEPTASPDSFATEAFSLRSLEPILVGGCCGTTELHVAALHDAWYHEPAMERRGLGEPGFGVAERSGHREEE